MSCYNKCGYDEVTRERVSELEARERLYVQTVNGVYGPFITLNFPDVDSYTKLVDKVDNAIYVRNLLDYSTSPITFKARVTMYNNSVEEKVLPPVTEVNLGIMTPEGYRQIWKNKSNIEKMMAGSIIPAGNLNTDEPTQEQLIALWVQAMTDQPSDGDRLMNLYDNVIYLFASGVWYPISLASTPQATNSTLGTVKGSLSDGKCQVELDGTLPVNGWDATQEDILSKIPKTDIVTSIGETPSDIKVPSEKASKNALDLKNDRSVSVSNITILTTNWLFNTDSADLYTLGYLYQYTIPVTGMLATMIPTIVPSYAAAILGKLWNRCQSVTGGITIYSKSNVEMNILTALGQVI